MGTNKSYIPFLREEMDEELRERIRQRRRTLLITVDKRTVMRAGDPRHRGCEQGDPLAESEPQRLGSQDMPTCGHARGRSAHEGRRDAAVQPQ
jgi:hypothetical protein